MRVFSYVRVSSKGQVEGDGPQRQRDAISHFCGEHGLTLVREFFEAGVSGTVEGLDRPEFADMVTQIRAAGVEAVVVERMDRLARDLMVSEFLLRELRRLNVKVFATDQGALSDMAADGGDPTRTLIRQILAALAQWEKCALVKKLSAARERRRRETGRCEGGKFYGELPGERAVLEAMKNLRASGLTFGTVARMLNEAGFRNRVGKPWSRQMVFEILKRNKRKVT